MGWVNVIRTVANEFRKTLHFGKITKHSLNIFLAQNYDAFIKLMCARIFFTMRGKNRNSNSNLQNFMSDSFWSAIGQNNYICEFQEFGVFFFQFWCNLKTSKCRQNMRNHWLREIWCKFWSKLLSTKICSNLQHLKLSKMLSKITHFWVIHFPNLSPHYKKILPLMCLTCGNNDL